MPHLALSATLTLQQKKQLPTTLGLHNHCLIEENPDRPNIYLARVKKEKSKDVVAVYDKIYKAEIDKLADDPDSYPVTLMYIPLERMAEAQAYAIAKMGRRSASTAVYGTLYANQEPAARQVFSKELRNANPRVRLIFCTSTVSMGFDSPCIVRVIHTRPPRNLSDYMQEIGRAGRRGQTASACLHFGAADIARNVKDLNDDIVSYCNEENECLRKILLGTFGFEKNEDITGCRCCEICHTVCICTVCSAKGEYIYSLSDSSSFVV